MPDTTATGSSTPVSPLDASPANLLTLGSRCDAPAPLVVNGGPFVGCSRERDHNGQHKVEVSWGDWRDQNGDVASEAES